MVSIASISANVLNFKSSTKSNNTKRNIAFKSSPEKLIEPGSDAMLSLAQKLASALKEGNNKAVTETMSLLQRGRVREAIQTISENAPAPGFLKQTQKGLELTTFNWDGSEIKHVFDTTVEGFKNLGVFKASDDVSEIFQKAFNQKPKVSIGTVGWSSIKPQNVKGGTDLTKAQLSKKYSEAIEEFLAPVDNYFVKGIGINPKDRVLTSSVSYSGVDQAIMDLSKKQGIPTLTITPFEYGIYGQSKHPFPTVFTPEISDYVDIYSKLSDNIILTGGRDHAFKFDAGGKWLNSHQGNVIPVDVLKDFKGIEVPSTIDGKIENAAALTFEKFDNPFSPGLLEEFKNLPANSYKNELNHPAQQALASSIFKNIFK